MTTALSDFLPDILPLVPGCPDVFARRQLVLAARDLYEQTGAWRTDLEISTVAGTAEYALTLTAGEAASVFEVVVDGVVIEPVSLLDLGSLYHDWRNATGAPKFYFVTHDKKLRLVPIPDGVSSVVVNVVTRPTLAATDLPDGANDFHDALAHLALSRILATPGQPFSSVEAAAGYAALGASALDAIRNSAQRGNARGSVRTVPRFF